MALKKLVLRTGSQINEPPRNSLSAGYWGHDPKSRMLTDQVVERITKSNTDFLKMGVIADIWVDPQDNLDQFQTCSCVKTTTGNADVRCYKCYGTKKVPGYAKWGYNTMYYASTDPGFDLPDTIQKNTTTTMNTLQLSPGVTSASFTTPAFNVNNPYSSNFEYQAMIYNRARGNSNQIEWSIDNGANWLTSDIKDLVMERGQIKFRITLKRAVASDPSPQFEIIRLRHPIQDDPWIRIARPMGNRKKSKGTYGNEENESGLKFWTIPIKGSAQINGITVFDKPWLPDRFFFMIREGTFAGDRYITTSHERSEHIGVMTSQTFAVRRSQDQETFMLVF